MAKLRGLDVVFTILARFGGKSINLLVFLIVARNLSAEDLGVYGYVSITTLFLASLFDFGVRNSSAYFVGRDSARANSYTLYCIILWFIFNIFGLVTLWFVYQSEDAHISDLSVVLPSLVLMSALLFIRMLQGVLMGGGKMKEFNQSELASRTVLFISTAFLFFTHSLNLSNALWSTAISYGSSALFLVYLTIGSALKGKLSDYGLAKTMVTRGFVFMLSVVLMLASKRIAFYILSQMGTPDEVGVFFGLQRTTEVLTEIGLAVAVVVFSQNVRSEVQSEALDTAAKSTRMSFVFFSFLSLIAYVLAHYILQYGFGPTLHHQESLFRIILIGTLFGSIWTILYPSLSAIASPLTTFYIFLPNFAISFGAIWLLYRFFGIEGAGWATVVTNASISLSFILYFKYKFHVPVRDFLVPNEGDIAGIRRMIRQKLLKRK
jgi:O-antigen/teichoic acid export membrane protein